MNAKTQGNIMRAKKIWNPSTCSQKNGKYFESIIDDSVISCDKIIDAVLSGLTKTIHWYVVWFLSVKYLDKYFIGYKDDDGFKIIPLLIILVKTSANAKHYDFETKWMSLLVKIMNCWKNIKIFRIMPVMVLKISFIANLSIIWLFWKPK